MGSARKKSVNSATLIHDASARGDLTAVMDQIKCGVDVNSDRDGWMPLHMACQNGHTNVVGLLLKNGATPDATGPQGVTPLHLCAHKGHLQAAQMLLLFGAQAGLKDRDGCTALHYCCIWGHTRVADVMLHRGADPNCQNSDGWTPLHYAARHGHLDTTQLLVDNGAELEMQDSEGMTPRDVAWGHDVQRLIEKLTREPVANSEQMEALQKALQERDLELERVRRELVEAQSELSDAKSQKSHSQADMSFCDEEEEDDLLATGFQPRGLDGDDINKMDFSSDMLHNMDDETPRSEAMAATSNPYGRPARGAGMMLERNSEESASKKLVRFKDEQGAAAQNGHQEPMPDTPTKLDREQGSFDEFNLANKVRAEDEPFKEETTLS